MCDYLIEECFELVEAIRQNDPAETAEELGDVLFASLHRPASFRPRAAGLFTSALAGNVAKMIRAIRTCTANR